MRCHPDRGGSNEDMAAINRAYEHLHALLVSAEDEEEEFSWSDRVVVRTALDYLWSITRLLFAVALDDWAVDEAALLLRSLNAKAFSASKFARADDQLIDLIGPTAKLAERLTAAGDQTAAEYSLATASACLAQAEAHGLLHDGDVAKAEEVLAGRKPPRLVLNHIRQVENAFRLGAIDEKRYHSSLARLDQRQADKDEAAKAQEGLLRDTVFVRDLPVDRGLEPAAETPSLVPQPGYYEVRSDELRPDQQAEYLRAYGPDSSLELVKKYAFVRLSGIIRSVIYFSDEIDAGTLSEEVRALARLEPRCDWTANQVADVVSALAALPEPRRAMYADQLRELLEPNESPVGGFVIIVMPGPNELGGSFLDSARALGKKLITDPP
jgi:hypothetical protein